MSWTALEMLLVHAATTPLQRMMVTYSYSEERIIRMTARTTICTSSVRVSYWDHSPTYRTLSIPGYSDQGVEVCWGVRGGDLRALQPLIRGGPLRRSELSGRVRRVQ